MSNPSNLVSILNPQIPVNQGIYEQSTTQEAPLGTRVEVGERVFRYAKAGAALAAGQIACAPLAVTTAMGCTVAVDTAALGKTTLTLTAGTNIAANALADGYIAIGSSGLAGGGVFLKIKSHASFGSGSATCVLNVYDGIPVSTVAAGPAKMVANQFNGVIIGSQAVGAPVGVAPIAVTSGNYCWLQTWGIGAPIHQTATPVAAVLHLGTLGQALCTFDATTNGGIAGAAKQIGYNLNIAATAAHATPSFVQITP
jgi:hypothetical protein